MIVPSHVYSEYSLLSSTNRIESLVLRAKELGYHALALTDHHVMYGAVPFYEACLKHEIKPIIGLEVTIQEEETEALALLRLYAKNEQGYAHLMKIATILGHKKEKVCVTREEIAPYMGDLLIIVPFKDGPLRLFLQKGEVEKAYGWWTVWKGDTDVSDWFLEVGAGKENAELATFDAFLEKTKMKEIASHPCYFLTEEDAYAYQVAKAIKTGVKVADNPLQQKEHTYFLQTKEKMAEWFSDHQAALNNTELLATKCSFELDLNQVRLPKYNGEEKVAPGVFLRQLCEAGVKRRYKEITEAVRERLEKELDVIASMGFEDYFLVVWDFMKYARERGILTGPGRGSAAGSLVAYVLQITDVDPLKYDLLFERFLNHERVSMPDIDIDFPDHRRDEVIEYVQAKYGKDHVAQIITFGTLGARAVIRDVGKALGLQQAVIDRLAKAVPGNPGMTLEKALTKNKELIPFIEESEETKEFWNVAKQLEGLPKHVSTHAAGVVISGSPLPTIVALEAGQAGLSLTQAPMNVVEKLGLLKFDFLGLRNLTMLERMLALIEKHHQIKLSLSTIPLDDRRTYELLAEGDTTGVFQLESKGMRRVLTSLKPTDFEDIVAVNALYRPGPMDFIQTYIDGKYGKREISYVHSDLAPILKKTYGVIVYQEQIMQIASRLAGFTLAEADLLRRAISKKKKKELVRRREDFIKGAILNGYDETVAKEVFSLIERFADYGFNRSHAVAYSLISYQLAYIKAHYPLIFYTALFSSVWNHDEKLSHYIQEYKAKGHMVFPPSLHKSTALFEMEQDGIRFGLLSISHVGIQAVQAILSERRVRPFDDLFDFIIRLDQKKVTKKVVEQLIKAGAMDEFDRERSTLLSSIDRALQFASEVKQFQQETGGLFKIDMKTPHYEEMESLSFYEKLTLEKEALGFYLSGHPIESYHTYLSEVGRMTIYEAQAQTKTVRIAGIIIRVRRIRTKKGEQMAFALLSDETMEAELVLFPNAWQQLENVILEGKPVLIEGKVDQARGNKAIIVQKGISIEGFNNKDKLFLRIDSTIEENDPLQLIKKQLLDHKGSTPVIIYYERTSERKQLPMNYAVEPTSVCLEALYEILGKENVVLRKTPK